VPLQIYGHLKIPIQRVDKGILRPIVGAQVYVYKDRADNTPSIDSDGNVLSSPVLATLYDSAFSNASTLAQPLVTDNEGYIDCFVDNDEYHFRIVIPSGSVFGLLNIPQYSPRGRYE
jgi:hypothetical protein